MNVLYLTFDKLLHKLHKLVDGGRVLGGVGSNVLGSTTDLQSTF